MTGVRWSPEQLEGHLKSGKVRIAGAPAPERRCSASRAVVQADIKLPPKVSLIEERFAQQIEAAGLPAPKREYFHIPGRDFRLDFAWPALRIGVEVQGGAHRVKARAAADIEKRALGLLAGWRILEVNGAAVRDERGIGWLKQLVEQQ
jgi:hypothetical protein